MTTRRDFLRRGSLFMAGGLVLGDDALALFERLAHRKVYALGGLPNAWLYNSQGEGIWSGIIPQMTVEDRFTIPQDAMATALQKVDAGNCEDFVFETVVHPFTPYEPLEWSISVSVVHAPSPALVTQHYPCRMPVRDA